MTDLAKKLSTQEINKLKTAKIYSLYDLITFLPSGMIRVLPFYQFSPKTTDRPKYLDQAILQKITHKTSKKKFLVLDWHSQTCNRFYQTYLFSITKFTLKTLQVNKEYQLLLSYRNGFWGLDKYALFAGDTNDQVLKLGKSKIKDYLEVYYPQVGFLKSNFFKSVHNKLSPQDYVLNLEGLVPPNDIFPTIIDLQNIHKPTNYDSYKQTLDYWISFQVYLKVAVNHFLSSQVNQKQGLASQIEIDFLKSIVKQLPFELSYSQKVAIWELLQSLSQKTKQ